jgi:malate dehydrogenase (oxaloacetate-decarboxylating)(NADP+)
MSTRIERDTAARSRSQAERPQRGIALLADPRWNTSTAFSAQEHAEQGLEGLLPPAVEALELQAQRVPQQLDHKTSDLERYLYLIQLLEHNETLFYRVVMADPARFLPIIYDPNVGEACLKFGHIFRRPRGRYLAITQR